MVQVTMEKRRRREAEVRNEKDRTVRILNVRLLAVSVAVVALLAVLGYLRYENRLAYVADSFLNRAATMEEEKDWNQAGAYLRRYLRVNPADTEARVRLIQALEHSAVTRAQHRQLVALLYEILGLLPDRDDLRSKLAGQLLKIGDFSAAESEAGKLLSAESAADQCEARRVIAISMRARARRGGLVSLEQAAIALKKSLDDNSGDATIASLLAELYRANPDDVGVPNAASRADEIMDQLVAASPQDPGALLARYGYRRRHSLPESRQDLDTLLSQNPDHVEALLLAANEDYSSGAPNAREVAERKLLRAVELAPGDPRGYIALARIYSIGGDRKRAVEVLTDGRKKLESISLELDEMRSGLLIDLSHLEEADRSIAAVESEFRRRLPELPTIARRKQESVIRLLKGRLYFARNELEPAIAELNAVTASAEVPADVVAGSLERLQAHALLATIMGTTQRTDVAAAHWKVVAQSAPQFLDAGWKAGAAYLELGRPDEAIEQLERYVVLPSASPEAWNALVQSHLQKQMRLALADRNWSEFVATLKQAQQELPDRWELQFAEALYQIALDTEESKELATSLLRKIENNFSSDVEVWKRLALIYQQLASREDANRALARYEELETSVVSRMSLRAAILARNNQTEAASKLLLDALQTATPQERLELELTRAKLFLAARDPDAAQKIVSEIIAASQKAKPQALTLGIEIALMRRDFAAAKRWEEMLKVDSNADRFEWRYFRTRRLLGEYAHLDTDGRAELEQLIESLQSARPDWYPVIALVGRHAELKGETSKAVEAYELAIDCGDARPETMERLMSALYAEGRFSDANIYLARLKAERPTDPRIESMAILSAVKENRLDDALATAKEAVSRGSDDPMHYVWYGNLLLLDGQQQTAEEVYQKAIERFPEDGRVWNGYFSFLVRSNQADEARHVLEDWPSKVGIDGAAKNSVLAQGYEALGDLAAAESLYRKSVEMDPGNSADRLRLAKMLLSTDATAARTEFEAILKTDPKNSEARRHLAAILAASGGRRRLEPSRQAA